MAWYTGILRFLFPEMLWHFNRDEKAIYLTFDDGPDPDVTPQVLDLLRAHGAKATFFCIGKRVEAHPEIYRRIIDEGHAVGNHTWSHPNGWRTSGSKYTADVHKASQLISSSLFRPPYGKLRLGQWFKLRGRYRLVMWDVLPGDWKSSRSGKQIADRTMRSIRSGSIVVLHDSVKAAPRMLPALGQILPQLSSSGYVCKVIL